MVSINSFCPVLVLEISSLNNEKDNILTNNRKEIKLWSPLPLPNGTNAFPAYDFINCKNMWSKILVQDRVVPGQEKSRVGFRVGLAENFSGWKKRRVSAHQGQPWSKRSSQPINGNADFRHRSATSSTFYFFLYFWFFSGANLHHFLNFKIGFFLRNN